MFPIRDHNPSNRTPFVTWALIAVNVVIFLGYYPGLSGNERMLMAFFDDWALVPGEFLSGQERHTVLTSMFLHGGWMHLIGNMLFLYIFGDNLEDLMGHVWFLAFYLASGAAAAMGQVAANPGSDIPMVGASGAIAGVMGAYLLFFPRARIDVLVLIVIIIKIFTIPAWLMLGLWFALQLANGLVIDMGGGGVAYWAHAGGFVAGVLLVLPLWLKRGGPTLWEDWHGKPPHPEVEYVFGTRDGSRIPRVHQIRSARPSGQSLSDLSRIPRTGQRRTPRGPWSGGKR